MNKQEKIISLAIGILLVWCFFRSGGEKKEPPREEAPAAAVAQERDPSRQFRIIADDSTGLAISPEVLARVETEAAEIADRARAAAAPFCAVRLRRVLDDNELVPARDGHDRIHVGHLPVKMHRQNDFRPGRDRCLDLRRVHRPGVGIDIHEDRLGAAIKNCRRRRDEGHRYRDDFVAGVNAGGKKGEMQCGRSTVDGLAMPNMTIGRELFLERRDVRAKHELRAFDRPQDSCIDVGFDLPVLGFQVEKRDQGLFPGVYGPRQ